MSTLNQLADDLDSVLHDASKSSWERAQAGFTTLLRASEDQANPDRCEVTVVLEELDVETAEYEWKDGNVPSEETAEKLLDQLKVLPENLRQIAVEKVILQLDCSGHEIPELAIEQVRQHPDVFVPRLIHALRWLLTEEERDGQIEGNLEFMAMFLLVELDAREAYPLLVDVFRLSIDNFYSVADALLPSILARMVPERPELLPEFLQDTQIDWFTRWVALRTYNHCVRDGVMSRETAIDHIMTLTNHALSTHDREIITPYVLELAEFGASEARQLLATIRQKDLLDDSIVEWREIEQLLDDPTTAQKHLDECDPTGIDDTIAELSSWAFFQVDEEGDEEGDEFCDELCDEEYLEDEDDFCLTAAPGFDNSDVLDLEDLPDVQPPTETVRNEPLRIGRNDPCPCGSGKKFKKCCLNRKVNE